MVNSWIRWAVSVVVVVAEVLVVVVVKKSTTTLAECHSSAITHSDLQQCKSNAMRGNN